MSTLRVKGMGDARSRYEREADAESRSSLLAHLFELSSNLFDKPGDEISSQATFAGWSHTNPIITDKQRTLALRLLNKHPAKARGSGGYLKGLVSLNLCASYTKR